MLKLSGVAASLLGVRYADEMYNLRAGHGAYFTWQCKLIEHTELRINTEAKIIKLVNYENLTAYCISLPAQADCKPH